MPGFPEPKGQWIESCRELSALHYLIDAAAGDQHTSGTCVYLSTRREVAEQEENTSFTELAT